MTPYEAQLVQCCKMYTRQIVENIILHLDLFVQHMFLYILDFVTIWCLVVVEQAKTMGACASLPLLVIP